MRVRSNDKDGFRAARAAGLAIAILTGAGVSAAGASDTITVELDNAKLLKLPPGTDTLVIGNPAIADVAIQRNQVMVVTAKNHGSTNMIALDARGAIVSESRIVVVLPNRPEQVVVMRGASKETYSCNPECGATVQLGDEEKFFKGSMAQARDRVGFTQSGGR